MEEAKGDKGDRDSMEVREDKDSMEDSIKEDRDSIKEAKGDRDSMEDSIKEAKEAKEV